MTTRPLTVEVAELWRSGVPTWLFVLGPPVTLVVFVASIFSTDLGSAQTIAELVSWPYAVEGVIAGVAAIGCCLGTVAPRLAALCAAVGPIGSLGRDAGLFEVAIAAAWGGVLLLDAALRRRQASVSDEALSAGPADHSRQTAGTPGTVVGIGPVRASIAGASLIAIVASTWIWAERRTDFVALENRAVPGTGIIAPPGDAEARVTVDGTTYDFWDTAFVGLPAGVQVDVMLDPAGIERPFGPADADPDGWSDWIPLIGAGLVGLFVTLVRRWRAVRAVQRLLAAASDGTRVRLDVDDDTGRLSIIPVDGERPVCLLSGLELVGPDRRHFGLVDALDAYDVLRTETYDETQTSLSEVDASDDDEPPPWWEPREAVVRGLRRFGDQVVLDVDSPDGAVVVAVMGQAFDPRTVRGAVGSVLDRFTRTRRRDSEDPSGESSWDARAKTDEPGPFSRGLADHGATLRWLLVPGVVLGVWGAHWLWTPDGEHFGSWLFLVVSASMVLTSIDVLWSMTGRRVRVEGDRLVVQARGARDLLIDLTAVREVRVRPEYLVLDLEDDLLEEPVVVRPSFPGSRHGHAELESMRVEIQSALDSVRGREQEGPALGRRVSASTVVAALTTSAYVVAAITATGGQMPLFDLSTIL